METPMKKTWLQDLEEGEELRADGDGRITRVKTMEVNDQVQTYWEKRFDGFEFAEHYVDFVVLVINGVLTDLEIARVDANGTYHGPDGEIIASKEGDHNMVRRRFNCTYNVEPLEGYYILFTVRRLPTDG